MHAYKPSTWEEEGKVQNFKVILSYTRRICTDIHYFRLSVILPTMGQARDPVASEVVWRDVKYLDATLPQQSPEFPITQ